MIIAVKSEFFGLDTNGRRVTIAHFIGDSAADLPAISDYTSGGVQLATGSTFHSVADGADYEMQSGGTWVLTQPGQAAYTKAEIDTMISNINTLNEAQQIQIDYSINTGSKNKLHTLRSSGTSTTGLVYTLNSNGTYSLSGVTTANANISALCTLADIPAEFIGKYVILSGGVDTSIRLSVYNGNTQTQYTDTGDGVMFEVISEMISNPYTIRLLVNAGTDCNGVTIMPMIRLVNIANGDFEPYAPTNRELYQMILSL